jgi:hypothetical protein
VTNKRRERERESECVWTVRYSCAFWTHANPKQIAWRVPHRGCQCRHHRIEQYHDDDDGNAYAESRGIVVGVVVNPTAVCPECSTRKLALP